MSTLQAKRAEIASRYRKKEPRRDQTFSVTAVRIAEMNRLFRARYGHELSDDDAGRDDALVMCNHLAHCQNPDRRIRLWLELWAPWMGVVEATMLRTTVLANPLRWRADKLGLRLRLTEAERGWLRITTIGSIDMNKAERRARRLLRRRDRDRKYREQQRRANGAMLRTNYLAKSLTSRKPWQAMGISRRTWYRLGKPAAVAQVV
jgi:hypothetical protein